MIICNFKVINTKCKIENTFKKLTYLGINISKYRYILNKLLFNIYSIYVSPTDTKRYRCKDRTNECK